MTEEKYDVVETNFRKYSFPAYYEVLDNYADALDANELYNTNRPGHLPVGDTFRAHKNNMKELGIGADRGDTLLKEQRQTIRDLSELHIFSSVSYMKTIAIHREDPSLLHKLSLPAKDGHKTQRKSAPRQTVEIRVSVKHLKGVSGGIIIEGTHVRNGGPYLINLCKGDPTSEQSWYNPGGHYNSCGRIEVRDLEPASRYWVRLRTDGPDGPGPWSQPVSIIVL